MFRIIFIILVIAALSLGLSYMAEMEGKLVIQWPGGEIQPTLMQAVIGLTLLVFLLMVIWTLFRMVLSSPETMNRYFRRKKQEKGLDSLSSGMIALSSGDNVSAGRHAMQARRTLPNEPMTQMLRAQAAELQGDTAQASRIYESMLAASDTELMGLRGLYLLALQQSELVAAEQFAARAVNRRADLPWAVLGLFDLQCRRRGWKDALETLKIANDQGHISSRKAKRDKAVLLTALAQELEDSDMEEALGYALEANRLAPGLVPAAVIAGRIHAGRGRMAPALKIVRKAWRQMPHPDLAIVSAYARPGDSVRDRMQRIKDLASLTPGHREAAIAVANAAVEAQDWALAREVLGPLARARPTQRVCTLMARIEAADSGHKGFVKEWLARAINAAGDPKWVADGVVADEWSPISPVTHKLDAFNWQVPPEEDFVSDETLTLKRLLAGLVVAEGIERDGDVVDGDTDAPDGGPDDDGGDGGGEAQDMAASGEADYDSNLPVVVDEDSGDKTKSAEDPDEDSVIDDDDDETPAVILAPPPDEAEPDDEAGDEKQPNKSARVAGGGKAQKGKQKRRRRTKIYVAPPAPDDPGTDSGDDIDVPSRARPIRY